MKATYAAGATPLDADELEQLLPRHVTHMAQLDELEEAAILRTSEWLFARRRGDPLEASLLHAVHQRMFAGIWRWAGKTRLSDKNIGVAWFEVTPMLRLLRDDVRFQIDRQVFPPDEIAARFHHRLVAIHAYANGNGRHARLMADHLLFRIAGRRLDWGATSLSAPTERRGAYIAALRAADRGDYSPLFTFLDLPASR